jgi:hypothetical protein
MHRGKREEVNERTGERNLIVRPRSLFFLSVNLCESSVVKPFFSPQVATFGKIHILPMYDAIHQYRSRCT